MHVTFELPDDLVRAVEAMAAASGQSPAAVVAAALRAMLAGRAEADPAPAPDGVGALRHMHEESARLQAEFDLELEFIEPGDDA